jgi:hypothetical protein
MLTMGFSLLGKRNSHVNKYRVIDKEDWLGSGKSMSSSGKSRRAVQKACARRIGTAFRIR